MLYFRLIYIYHIIIHYCFTIHTVWFTVYYSDTNIIINTKITVKQLEFNIYWKFLLLNKHVNK